MQALLSKPRLSAVGSATSVILNSAMVLHASGPEYNTLNTWCTLPGWAATMEALQQGVQGPATAWSSACEALIAGKAMNLILNHESEAAIRASISLAATVRKFLWPYLKQGGRDATWARCAHFAKDYVKLLLKFNCADTMHSSRVVELVDVAASAVPRLNICVSSHGSMEASSSAIGEVGSAELCAKQVSSDKSKERAFTHLEGGR